MITREGRLRWPRRTLPAVVLVAAATLTACGSTGNSVPTVPIAGPAITPSVPTSSASPTTTPDTAAATTDTTTTDPSPSTTSTAPAGASVIPIAPAGGDGGGGPAVCPTSSLSVTLGEGEGTTSGTVYRPLVFTNTGTATCRLQGFPGVSHVAGDDGHQVGRAGAWVGPRGAAVALEPGSSAHSVISVTDAGLIDRASCAPVEVRGFRVYPPASTGAAYVPSPGVSCSADIATIRVRTILPGRGDLGGGAGVVAPACTTGSLSVGLGEAEGAAGSRYQPLVFRNTGSSVCAMQGFPRVSHVAGDDGHQVGPDAQESGEAAGRVELAPGDAATAIVRTSATNAFDTDRCDPTAVRGLRVYPPGQDAAAYVPRPGTSCAGDVVTLRVRAVRSDAD